MTKTPTSRTIAVLGGTGKEGTGLAFRWARAGHHILIGSRTPEKARAAAAELTARLGGGTAIEGATNAEAARRADIVVLTVPYAAHAETLELVKDELPGKTLVDVTVPLVPPRITQVQMPPAGSAAQEAHRILGERVQVASAFQNISHQHLLDDEPIDCDVLVTGTSKEARAATLQLVRDAGLVGWDAGPIENSVVVEGLTSILIGINRELGGGRAGIRITGVD